MNRFIDSFVKLKGDSSMYDYTYIQLFVDSSGKVTHLFHSLVYSIYFTILDLDVAPHGTEEFDDGYRKLT